MFQYELKGGWSKYIWNVISWCFSTKRLSDTFSLLEIISITFITVSYEPDLLTSPSRSLVGHRLSLWLQSRHNHHQVHLYHYHCHYYQVHPSLSSWPCPPLPRTWTWLFVNFFTESIILFSTQCRSDHEFENSIMHLFRFISSSLTYFVHSFRHSTMFMRSYAKYLSSLIEYKTYKFFKYLRDVIFRVSNERLRRRLKNQNKRKIKRK